MKKRLAAVATSLRFIPLMNTHGSVPRDLIESRAPPPSVSIHSLCHFAVKFTFRRQKYSFTFILPNISPTFLRFVFKFRIKRQSEAITSWRVFAHFFALVNSGEFFPIEGEPGIFSAISDQSDDYDNLIKAARKAVEHGYRVYLLPNPKGIRSADFIFVRKGVLKLFDLKTIAGRNSVDNRLSESVGQTNRVLLHMTADYNPGTLARSIKRYFELNPYAREVLVYKGKKQISVTRKSLEDTNFFRTFIRRYTK